MMPSTCALRMNADRLPVFSPFGMDWFTMLCAIRSRMRRACASVAPLTRNDPESVSCRACSRLVRSRMASRLSALAMRSASRRIFARIRRTSNHERGMWFLNACTAFQYAPGPKPADAAANVSGRSSGHSPASQSAPCSLVAAWACAAPARAVRVITCPSNSPYRSHASAASSGSSRTCAARAARYQRRTSASPRL